MGWLLVALGGGVICTLCDYLHVAYGVTAYARPVAFGQAWWVLPLFASVSALAVFGASVVRRAFGGRSLPAPAALELSGDVATFVTAYVFTALASTLPTVVLLVLVGWWAGRAARLPLWVTAFSLGTAIAGSLTEAVMGQLGLFWHLRRDFLGVVRWLPAMYLHAALLAAPLESLLLRQVDVEKH
jgi:hypothetical protein